MRIAGAPVVTLRGVTPTPLSGTTNDGGSSVDVVICTRNRADKIGQALASVLACDHPDVAVTVIDQSTNDDTRQAIEAVGAPEGRIRYHHVDQTGLSKAYNTGIAATTGDLIAFTDDDCIVPTDWLSNIVAAFEADPEADLLYGRVVPLPDGEPELTPFLDITEPARLGREDRFRVFGMGANFAARRRLFTSIGGFDEVLGGGGPLRSSQDFDLAYRAYRGGHVIALRPEVWLHHDGRRESQDWPTLLRNYGVGDGGFYSKHVRCRDPYALWLLAKQVAGRGGRRLVKRVLGRASGPDEYVRGVWQGIREGRRFEVRCDERLYGDRRDSTG